MPSSRGGIDSVASWKNTGMVATSTIAAAPPLVILRLRKRIYTGSDRNRHRAPFRQFVWCECEHQLSALIAGGIPAWPPITTSPRALLIVPSGSTRSCGPSFGSPSVACVGWLTIAQPLLEKRLVHPCTSLELPSQAHLGAVSKLRLPTCRLTPWQSPVLRTGSPRVWGSLTPFQ